MLKYIGQKFFKLLFADSFLFVFVVLIPKFVNYALYDLVSCSGFLFAVIFGAGVELDE